MADNQKQPSKPAAKSGKNNAATSNGSGAAQKQSGTVQKQSGTVQKQSAASSSSAKPNGPFSASDLNRIVLEYLNKKGYHQTEAMLRNESKQEGTPSGQQQKQSTTGKAEPATNKATKEAATATTTTAPASNKQASNEKATKATNAPAKRDAKGNIIAYEQTIMKTSPESYLRAYKLLKEWVDSSLEMYKTELNFVLYPIFIYIFLKLVSTSPIHARAFFDKYSTDFRVLHGTEINRLFSVNSVDHIKENELANAFQSNKYRVTISKTTLNLLLYFLNEHESSGGSLVISVINQNLEPNIVETVTTKDRLSDGLKLLTDTGKISKDVEMNNLPVKLGKFPQDDEFVKEIETELRIMDEKEKQQLAKDPSLIQSYIQNRKSLLQQFRKINLIATNDKSSDFKQGTVSSDKQSNDDEKKSGKKFDDDSLVSKVNKSILEPPLVDSLPLPPKNALNLKLEIQKVKETRECVDLSNLRSELPSVCMYTFHNTNREMLSLDFSDDCRLAAAGFQDSYIKIWSLDGSSLDTLTSTNNTHFTKKNTADNNLHSKKKHQEHVNTNTKLVGHSGAVYSTSFSPDNKLLISGSEDKTVRLWAMDTQSTLVSYKGHNHPVWDVAFSPMGHYFATASHDQTARLWSCDHIYSLRIFAGHLSDVDCVTFHPNGCYVFTGSSDKTCRMWDVSTGETVRLFLGHTAPVVSLGVSPDGRWLASGSEDGLINVWDIGSGKRLKQMRGHGRNAVNSIVFSQEGTVIISGGTDNSVRVWDMYKSNNESSINNDTESDFSQSIVGYFGNTLPAVFNDTKDYGTRDTIIPTNDLVASFYSKKTPIFNVKFTRSNLVFAGGPYTEL
ncbi:hypothetical protein Kpol_1024p42 [Vanderwaltozyma polyspora DSM 70294]|uniref:TFIID subunit TAF5 NTD2 domain-containing protein n=1 Tax=Vanderwaltozyma polyspora (strain ATCC 22028 / DSM 70294 / BCRC 21397 / CBS 2163 / NBRC 10782 / NRRL Y-8283 / UCD 57-17) TaxID=436907 RepID=A7TLK2_VANPO|nr:uncharacterized protein Kpol_1024p42 [Vanderwaltozyma polyspora DSM 70294]EDO16888.1 hypothetical protein Kpol_1024p42 [Vanderwaltozyma polyspora DSM 70294]